ncbi:MAG: hypothetical protein HW410_1744 [Nitrosarchaeum sp.]|nr:hypothetical protein [Nitrosarchaeum sp.]
MKTIFIVTILSIIITGSIIFAIIIQSNSYFPKEHYEIKITGMKDVYLIGERYDFSYILSGYGHSCGSEKITFPDQNGYTVEIISSLDCIAGISMKEFVSDIQKEYGTTYGHVRVKNPGYYGIVVEFESNNYKQTQGGHGFHVVEKICNDKNSKDKAQCFADAFDSCTSAFVDLAYPTGEGDGIFVTGIVESWNDCNLRVYTDHTQDRYKANSSGTRSICDGVMINDESITFENCNNEEIPPLFFDQQYYLHKERCEIYGGWWDFEFNTCFDFTDDYDCKSMGGELVSKAYTGEQPDYSKKSDSFVCKFRK